MKLQELLDRIHGSDAIFKGVKTLRDEKSKILLELSFLKATIGNPNQEKLDESYSGQIASRFVPWAASLAVMGINRCFDGRNPPFIIDILETIREKRDEIATARRACFPDWSDSMLGLDDLNKSIDHAIGVAIRLSDSDEYKILRIFRTEVLAHSLQGVSTDRIKYQYGPHAALPTYNLIMEFAEKTIKLIDDIILFWEFSSEGSVETLSIFESYGRMFWDSLPKFREVEDTRLLADNRPRLG